MDINTATRSAASLVTSGIQQANTLPGVGGNSQSADSLLSRAAGQPESASRTGNGDNSELRAHKGRPGQKFSPEEQAELQELRARDREVRAHEMAHLAAAGRHARGGANFRFESGPDGRRYAVAGEVSIDTSEVPRDPAATLVKAQQVRRAALAPVNPSAQDRQVAAQAAAMATQASAELAQQRAAANNPDGTTFAANAVDQTYSVPATVDETFAEWIA